MNTRTITLHGDFPEGVSISGPLLYDLLALLVEGTKRALRLRVEGRSAAQGRDPGWLQDAAYFELSQIREGSRELVLSSPLLPDALHKSLLPFGIDQGATAIDLLSQSLDTAKLLRLIEDPSSTSDLPTDAALVKALTPLLKRIFSAPHIKSVLFSAPTADVVPLTLDASHIDALEALASKLPTYPTQTLQLRGRLISLHAETGEFSIKTHHQAEVRGILLKDRINDAIPMFNQDVYIKAEACFLPRSPASKDADIKRIKILNDAALYLILPLNQPQREQVAERFAALASLQSGWLGDGDGQPYAQDFLARVEDITRQLIDTHNIAAPFIYGTPDEEVQLEWSYPPWEVEVVFDPSSRALRMTAGQVNIPPTYCGQIPHKEAHAHLDQPNLIACIAAFLATILPEVKTQ